MARTIAQRELRNDNAAIIDAVEAGESFVVTRNGAPVAEIRPLPRQRQTIVNKAELSDFAGAPHIDRNAFRADLDGLADPYER